MHLTYASRPGQALVDRALYLTRNWAADDERRELTGVPDELAFATKPQLAATMLERARQAGVPARWVAADEIYGGHDLRTRIRELGYGYAVTVPARHRVTTPAGASPPPHCWSGCPARPGSGCGPARGTVPRESEQAPDQADEVILAADCPARGQRI